MNSWAVILIHGYNVSWPFQTVGKLRPYFEQLPDVDLVENFTYGYWPFPWQITKINPWASKRVAARVAYHKSKGRKVLLVGHSNGCAIAMLACTAHRAPADRVLAFHPALRRYMPICKHAEKVVVVHNKGDRAVRAGKLLGLIAKIFVMDSWVFRPWGEMGAFGYAGGHPNHVNLDTGPKEHLIRCWGHSDEFKDGKHEFWVPYSINEVFDIPQSAEDQLP